MIEVEEKIDVRSDTITASRQKIEEDRCSREQEAIRLFNQCMAKIQGKELRCAIQFIWVTKDDGKQQQKGIEILIKALD